MVRERDIIGVCIGGAPSSMLGMFGMLLEKILFLNLFLFVTSKSHTLSYIISLFILFDFFAKTGAAISAWNLNERDLMVAPAIQSENLID